MIERKIHHDFPEIFTYGITCNVLLRRLSSKPTKHSRPKNNGKGMRSRQNNRHTASICKQLHHVSILRLPAGHVNGCDGVSLFIHLVNDVSSLEGDSFDCEIVFACEIIQAIRLGKLSENFHYLISKETHQLQSNDGSSHTGVSNRRSVA